MKQFLFALFTLSLGLSLTFGTYAQEREKVEKKDTVKEVRNELNTSSGKMAVEGKPVNTICPVSGEEADATITHTYEGKTYALCCNKCLKKFKADPEKYISRIEKNENSGEKPQKKSSD